MSTKKRPRSGRGKKFTADHKIALAVAFIGAMGLIVAALVTGIFNNGSTSSRPPQSDTTSRAPSPLRSSTNPSPSQELSGSRSETDEYQAMVYGNYAGPSDVEGQIDPGQTATVYCRVPGDSATPSSVGSAGWYKIKGHGGGIGYVAANVFYNDPGNGLGMTPNNIKFDPLVRTC
jgi:hypothetical protein